MTTENPNAAKPITGESVPVPYDKVGIVGFSQDIGASRRGVDMGPYAVRAEGLESELAKLGYEVKDFGTIHCVSMDDSSYLGAEYRDNPRLKYLEPIRRNMLQLKERVEKICGEERFPIILGGDHSMSMGSIAGLGNTRGCRQGLLWVDAHGDFNTPESTETGNIHGMPLAVVTGRGDSRLLEIGPFPGVDEEHTVLFGVRDLDKEEIRNLSRSGLTVITMRNIIERGFFTCVNEALRITSEGVEYMHVSFDMDSIDPLYCPGTGTSVPGGLIDREALYIMERVAETGKLSSLDLVEVNPALDQGNKTARFAVELIARALGKKTV